MKLGLDIGSTTIKCVVLDNENKLIYSTYERHYSQITEKIAENAAYDDGRCINDRTHISALSFLRCKKKRCPEYSGHLIIHLY